MNAEPPARPPPTPLDTLRDELEVFLTGIREANPSSAYDDLALPFLRYVANQLSRSTGGKLHPRVARHLEHARQCALARNTPALIAAIDSAIHEMELRPTGGGPDGRRRTASARRRQR